MTGPFVIAASLLPNLNPPDRGAGRAIPTTFALGTIYHFPNAGDELPLHTHPPGEHNHISVVLAGSLQYTEGPVVRILAQSEHEIIDVPSGVLHGFKALEPDSIVLNIRKPSANAIGSPSSVAPFRYPLPPGVTRRK